MRKYSELEVKEKLEIALGMLLKNDAFLLEHDVNECSSSHKLAEYLQQLFPDYHVDCEYNKRGEDIPKTIQKYWEKLKGDNPLVYPDIVVHRRNSEDNLLVIEAKNSSNGSQKERDYDLIKLKAYLSRGDKYSYKVAAFIEYPVGSREVVFRPQFYTKEEQISFVSEYYGKV